MVDLPVECQFPDIPPRLHRAGRAPVAELDENDWIYMRHTALPAGEPYVGQIPGHNHFDDQSVVSHNLSMPDGLPTDARYDGEHGHHCWECQIARFSVQEIHGLNLPNENTKIIKVKGQPPEPAIYTFRVVHVPTECIYPHCEIHAFKDGVRLQADIGSKPMRSLIRKKFAEIAE